MRFSPQREMRPFARAVSREKPHIPSSNAKGYLTPFMQLRKVPEIHVPTREECRVSCHNSRRAPFPPSSIRDVLRARVRYSARDKGHEEGGSTYAKAGSSLRSPPGTPRAYTPITRACLLYYFVLLPTPITLRGAVPHHLFRRRS